MPLITGFKSGVWVMAAVFDVAKYITERAGELSAMKLQNSQAWSFVWMSSTYCPAISGPARTAPY